MGLIGAHISISKGIENASKKAKKQGCEIMQIFVQPPQQYRTPETSDLEIKKFKESLKLNNIKEVYVHAPYIVNLASKNNRIRYGSINIIKRNLEKASFLGCKYLMTHLGSYKENTKQNGINLIIKSIKKIMSGYKGKCMLLLELSAGSGHIIGSKFEEIHKILTGVDKFNIGICLDTAHIFASGYDIRTQQATYKTINEFDKIIGIDKLKLIHLNDSLAEFNSKKDRHANIGDGKIGIDNLKIFLNHKKLRKINIILETPGDDKRRLKDIRLLKSLRKQKHA